MTVQIILLNFVDKSHYMKPLDLKYLLAYIIPTCTFVSIYELGWMSYFTVLVSFGIIPIIESLAPKFTDNLTDGEKQQKESSVYFDVLLYLNIVWVYGGLYFLVRTVMTQELALYEMIGLVLSMGILLGSNGINVAHELGHKSGWLPQTAAKLLLLPSFYMHFIIEHNKGHHLHVGTPKDPATSRLNEYVYGFWFRSTIGGIISAWEIEKNELLRQDKQLYSLSNSMIQYSIIQLAYAALVAYFFGSTAVILVVASGIVGFLLLESINYIEHYGLVRNKLENGRYERVENFHSWNSNHQVGRILLYELTRHSDHHYKANKKYQILNHYDESPQLPYGYPSSIVLAMFPMLWFKIMNPLVAEWRHKHITPSQV